MVPLTGQQKRRLRSLGQKLRPVVLLGKAGVSEAIVAAADECLRRCELIKLRLPPGPPAERRASAEGLARAVGACCAGVVGRTGLLYRPNPGLPPARRIDLPQGD